MMNLLHQILFKDYPVPPAYDPNAKHRELEKVKYKRLDNPRQMVLDLIQTIGRCSSTEIAKASEGKLNVNLINRHLEKLRLEGTVKQVGWAAVTRTSGQRSKLWGLTE